MDHIGFGDENFLGLNEQNVTFSQIILTSFSGMVSSFSRVDRYASMFMSFK